MLTIAVAALIEAPVDDEAVSACSDAFPSDMAVSALLLALDAGSHVGSNRAP